MFFYLYYKFGDECFNDKIFILEDMDGDGKVDWQIIFVDGLYLFIGFEIVLEGVYVF